MAIERRSALRLLAGALVGSLSPGPLRAEAARDARLYLSARATAAGGHWLTGLTAGGRRAFDLPLPGRGHSFAVQPGGHTAVHFARRPGRFALVIDLVEGSVTRRIETPIDRHFYGHGVFSRDGARLYATENDFGAKRGVIGVYDAEHGYRRLGELPSHGVGPHEIALLSDCETLVVANGGIATHPDLPRVMLNLPTMAPSLCHVDRHSGRLLKELTLAPTLHRLSIRHLAVGPGDTVVVATQYEGPAADLVPLVALHRGDGRRPASAGAGAGAGDDRLRLLTAPRRVLRSMKHYCGSVCFDPSGRAIAVSAPRGNLITIWDADTGRYRSSARVSDGCGVAPGVIPGEFLATSGRGGVSVIDARSGAVRPLDLHGLEAARWDNHLIEVGRT